MKDENIFAVGHYRKMIFMVVAAVLVVVSAAAAVYVNILNMSQCKDVVDVIGEIKICL